MPDWEVTKNHDQEKATLLDRHVKRLIKEYNDMEAQWLVRGLHKTVGDEAEDILYEGLNRLWKARKHLMKLDSTVRDVKYLMRTICKNLVSDYQRRRKRFKWLPLACRTKDEDGNDVEREVVYLDGFENSVCEDMLYRDVMAELLKHFNEEDRACIELMARDYKPREISIERTGSPDQADRYRKRCERIRERMRALLREMPISREEFNPDGG